MTETKQIYDFAVKWGNKFCDPNISYIELVDHWMADDCAALGFVMDAGHAFTEKYGKAASDYEALSRIIDDVTDIALLGSAIYSQWRYFNHWAYTGAEILELKNSEWFSIALNRLALISSEHPSVFQGIIKTIRILSNNMGYDPIPEPDEEIEQHIIITDEGDVWFSGYSYRQIREKYEPAKVKSYSTDKAAAGKLLNAIAAYFSNEFIEVFATDIGSWVLDMTNTDGVTYTFQGSLCADFDYEGIDLSDLVRDTVGMNDLFVFDGNNKPDMINRITIDYYRHSKFKPKIGEDNPASELFTWKYTEHLTMDRESKSLEHTQMIGSGYKVSRKYEIDGATERLLNKIYAEDLLKHTNGNLDVVIDEPNATRGYTITIDYMRSPRQILTGSFNKDGLPEKYALFAEMVSSFKKAYGLGEILDLLVYGKAKRRQSEFIYCSVIFDENYKNYYYLTDDDTIEIGDLVLVPAGKDNVEEVVEVVDIEYFSEVNAPLAVEKTKHIICKLYNRRF